MLYSCVRISYFRTKDHLEFHWYSYFLKPMLYHSTYAILGLNYTWLCRKVSLLDLNNSFEAGCCYRGGDKESVGHELRVNKSLLTENTSYLITVLVTKDERQAEYTQEVYIIPGDPPEVQIRYTKFKKYSMKSQAELTFLYH